ncbi:MAG: hypothetical protein HY000_12365 [Planctomycetes bacterium]|nr:hypothetical protein [Planctomycetota bacterium]
MSDRRGVLVVVALLLCVAVGVAAIVWRSQGVAPIATPAEDGAETASANVAPAPALELQRRAALGLQRDRPWCEAKAAWQKLLDQLTSDTSQQDLRAEAERNLQLMENLCHPPTPPLAEISNPDGFPKQKPPEVPQDELVRFYPVGRKVRSLAHFEVEGTGNNRKWMFQQDARFVYLHRIPVETRVTKNTGMTVVFQQDYGQVEQLRADCKEELHLEWPDSPILDAVWRELEAQVLNHVPIYVAVKRVAAIVDTVDPNLRRSLTWFKDQLERSGYKLIDDQFEIVAQVDRLAGLQLEFEYVSGLGVTKVAVLKGQTFDPDDLERLALNSSLLMDYFLDRDESVKPGEDFKVTTAEIGSIVNPGYDVEVGGELMLRKQDDARLADESVHRLEVVGGELRAVADDGRLQRTGTLKPQNGYILYSPDKLLVRRAEASWKANIDWVSTDHLLFGTEVHGDVDVKTLYEADVVP